MSQSTPSEPTPRFTQELEFVLCLANPVYLQHLAVTLPHIFNPSIPTNTNGTSTSTSATEAVEDSNADSAKFTRYLSYLHSYWSTPAYSQYLTHPAATLRHLELLQSEQFRRDLTRPDLLPRLAEGYSGAARYVPPGIEDLNDESKAQPDDEVKADAKTNGESEQTPGKPRTPAPISQTTYGGVTSRDILRNRGLANKLEQMSEAEYKDWLDSRAERRERRREEGR